MLKQGFYYFLLVAELAILGLLIAGIYSKVKGIMSLYAEKSCDQYFEHDVSVSDQIAEARSDIFPQRADEPATLKSEQIPLASNS